MNKQEIIVKTKSNFPIVGILGLIFITLKLTGHIDWSWWWVLAPFWGALAFVLLLCVLVLGAAFVVIVLKTIFKS